MHVRGVYDANGRLNASRPDRMRPTNGADIFTVGCDGGDRRGKTEEFLLGSTMVRQRFRLSAESLAMTFI